VKKQKITSYKDLLVWQKSHLLAKKVISICSNFPASEEAKVIKSQLIRSSTSVPANIAEGYGAEKGKVFKNSLVVARREATETEYWLLLSYELNFIDYDCYNSFELDYREIRAMLTSLIKKLLTHDS